MKTKGEMEAAVCDKLSAFELEYMGQGPKGIRAHLLGDILLVRLNGHFSEAERKLIDSQPPENGIEFFRQVRARLIDAARPAMNAVVQKVTGVNIISLHHDFSAASAEEFLLFALAKAPTFREPRQRRSS